MESWNTSPRARDAVRSPSKRRFLRNRRAEDHSPRVRRSLTVAVSPSCFVKPTGSPIARVGGAMAGATTVATAALMGGDDDDDDSDSDDEDGRASDRSRRLEDGHESCVACCAALCPELVIVGREMQDKAPLQLLFKKGKRFDSDWEPFYVGIFGQILYFYEQLSQPPRGIVPLHCATVKAVDRIFRNQKSPLGSPQREVDATTAHADQLDEEDCGPCWKLTSSANRVFLFRTGSITSRNHWIMRINQIASQRAPTRVSLTSNGSSLPENDDQELSRVNEMLRDALRLVEQQKEEIEELKKSQVSHTTKAVECASPVLRNSCDQQIASAPVLPPSPPQQFHLTTPPASASAALTTPPTAPAEELQRKANELAEFARSLQSSFNVVPLKQPTTKSHSTGGSDCATAPNSTSTEKCSSPISSHSATMSSHDGDELDAQSDSGKGQQETLTSPLTNTSDSVLKAINNLMERFLGTEEDLSAGADQAVNSGEMMANIHMNLKKQQSLQRRIFNTLETLPADSSRRDVGHARSLSADEVDLLEQPNGFIKSVANGFTSLSVSFDALDELEITPALRTSKCFLKTLVQSDMGLVGAILQSATRDEKVSILMPILRLFAHENRLNELIFWAIDTEVDSVMDVATLFRSDDYATRLLSTYSKSVGLNFIKHALKEPIRKLCASSMADYDLQPGGVNSTEELPRVTQNATNLMNACQEIINNLLEHGDKIPTSYYHICGYLREKASQRFEEMMFLEEWTADTSTSLTRSVLGGFLFLRFICPAITTPHMYELIDEPPSAESRRLLVLVTKLLFKTATYVMFGDKEPCLRVLNSFVAKNAVNIERIYTRMTSPVKEDIATSFARDSRHIFFNFTSRQLEDDLRIVRAVARIHLSAVESKLRVDHRFPQQQLGSLRRSLQEEDDQEIGGQSPVQQHDLGDSSSSTGSSNVTCTDLVPASPPRRKQKKLSLNFLTFGRKARKNSEDFV